MVNIKAEFFKEFEDRLPKALQKQINISLFELKKSIESFTPEDTKRLVESYELQRAKIKRNEVSWKVVNKTPYWIFVEYWIWGDVVEIIDEWENFIIKTQQGENGLIYKYNKPKWTIFRIWTWARMFARWEDATKDLIISNLSKAIWQAST